MIDEIKCPQCKHEHAIYLFKARAWQTGYDYFCGLCGYGWNEITKGSEGMTMNMAKKFREEKGMEWPEPPESFEELKFGCPWGMGSELRLCTAIRKSTNFCSQGNCAVLYWLRKMGK